MKHSTMLKMADKHRIKMQRITDAITSDVAKLLEDDGNHLDVFYQHGDGWVVMFGDALNARLTFGEFDKLLSLNSKDALEFLMSKTI